MPDSCDVPKAVQGHREDGFGLKWENMESILMCNSDIKFDNLIRGHYVSMLFTACFRCSKVDKTCSFKCFKEHVFVLFLFKGPVCRLQPPPVT